MKNYICKSEEDKSIWVSAYVVLRVYDLIKKQKSFYKKRTKLELYECKAREDAFLKWAEAELLPLFTPNEQVN